MYCNLIENHKKNQFFECRIIYFVIYLQNNWIKAVTRFPIGHDLIRDFRRKDQQIYAA